MRIALHAFKFTGYQEKYPSVLPHAWSLLIIYMYDQLLEKLQLHSPSYSDC